LVDRTKEFEAAVARARNHIIQQTGRTAQYIGMKTALAHRDIETAAENTSIFRTAAKKYHKKTQGKDAKVSEVRDIVVQSEETNARRYQKILSLVNRVLEERYHNAILENSLRDDSYDVNTHLLALLLQETKSMRSLLTNSPEDV
jgi:hypothetical protein